MKTILVPTEQGAAMVSALDTALLLARKFDSSIEGFPLRPAVADLVAMDPDSGLTMVAVKENDAEMVRQAETLFRSFMDDHRIAARAGEGQASLSWAWLKDAPSGHDFVGSYGRVFDVIVLARPGDEWQSPSMITLESALFESGRPVLIAPPTSPRSLGTNILVAWNNSTEQARTMADAMPLLRLAGRITILTVEGATVAGPSGEQMARSLKMNGIAAETDHDETRRQAQRRRDHSCQGRRARLRSHRQGRLHAEPPAPDDLRRHHAAYPRQCQAARADGALTDRHGRLATIEMHLVLPQLQSVYQTLAPLGEALLRVVVGLWMVPHGLRMAFGLFPDTGIRQGNLHMLAADLDAWGYRPGWLWAPLIAATELVGARCWRLDCSRAPPRCRSCCF